MMGKTTVSLSVTENGKKAPQYSINSDINGEITLADFYRLTKNTLILVSDQVLKEEQAKGFDKKPVFVVDGKFNKSPFDVNPLGRIEIYARQSLAAVLLFTYEAILTRSQVDTGLYKESNFVFFRGRLVATTLTELQQWLATNPSFETKDRVRFVNITPYAARLERLGVSRGHIKAKLKKSKDEKQRSGQLIAKPNGTYTLATRAAKAKFKTQAFIKFEFLPGGYIGNLPNVKGPRGNILRKTFSERSKYNKGDYLYPTIIFSLQQTGLVDE